MLVGKPDHGRGAVGDAAEGGLPIRFRRKALGREGLLLGWLAFVGRVATSPGTAPCLAGLGLRRLGGPYSIRRGQGHDPEARNAGNVLDIIVREGGKLEHNLISLVHIQRR
ncbi:hypothetical protein SKB0092_25790 [Roseomonas mucosa]